MGFPKIRGAHFEGLYHVGLDFAGIQVALDRLGRIEQPFLFLDHQNKTQILEHV